MTDLGFDPTLPRCWWSGATSDRADPAMVRYHDDDWGRPCHDDAELFERFVLEAFQAGLSWSTILHKRDAFRLAFRGFDPAVVARFDDGDRARLMADAGIVRNRAKIDATIANAAAWLATGREFGSVDAYLEEIRQAPYMDGTWDWAMESYFRAELTTDADGTVRSATSADAVAQAMAQVLGEPWADLVARVPQPTLLVNATADYGPPGAGALVPEVNARATARMFRDGRYAKVSGNHLTMVFGGHARAVAAAIAPFAAGADR